MTLIKRGPRSQKYKIHGLRHISFASPLFNLAVDHMTLWMKIHTPVHSYKSTWVLIKETGYMQKLCSSRNPSVLKTCNVRADIWTIMNKYNHVFRQNLSQSIHFQLDRLGHDSDKKSGTYFSFGIIEWPMLLQVTNKLEPDERLWPVILATVISIHE